MREDFARAYRMTVGDAVVDRVGTAGSEVLGRPPRLALTSARRRSLAALGAVWILGVLYESYFLFRGWFPHDDGALAESARRVLAGELPHRDFAELYTGTLSYVHALAFLAFGEELTSMRLVLLAFFIAWIPALYGIARYFASPGVAAACVAAAIVWSVPNYSASMPSWYILFFATFAVAFFLRYCDDRRARWLVAAGLACGVSVTFKSTGIYVVLALVLAILFDVQIRPTTESSSKRMSKIVLVAACVATFGFLIVLVHRRLGVAEAVNFVLPGTCIALFLAWNAIRRSSRPSPSLRSLVTPIVWFGLGVALPVVAFITSFALAGGLGALVDGVLVEPSSRLQFAAWTPPSIASLPVTLLVLSLVVALGCVLSRTNPRGRVVGAGLVPALFALSATSRGFWVTWSSVRDASLFLVPAGVVLLSSRARRSASNAVGQVRTFALLSLFAFASLVQFPFSAPIYFCYVAPLMFLAVLAVATYARESAGLDLAPLFVGGLFVFLAAFGVALENQSFFGGPSIIGQGPKLGLERAGSLRVSPSDARLYRHLVRRIETVGTSDYIYAGPDAPEVYFLADRRNPTRALFEFLEHGQTNDREFLQQLDRKGVKAVALNLRPMQSQPIDSRLYSALLARYPHHERIGRFELRWRE